MPLTLEGALRDDHAALALGVTSLLPNVRTEQGHSIVLSQGGNMDKKKASYESHLRVAWYVFHAAFEDEVAQQRGIVQIIDVERARLSEFDLRQTKRNLSNLAGTMPCRIGGVHVCKPPAFSNYFKPWLLFFLHEEVRSRLHFHVGSTKRVVKGMEKTGIPFHHIPEELGGGFNLDRQAWLDERLALGM